METPENKAQSASDELVDTIHATVLSSMRASIVKAADRADIAPEHRAVIKANAAYLAEALRDISAEEVDQALQSDESETE